MVDAAALAVAVAVGVFAFQAAPARGALLLAVNLTVGILMCAALWWRRRFPVALSALDLVTSLVSPLAQGPGLVLLLNLAVHAPPRRTVALGLAHAALVPLALWLYPDESTSFLVGLTSSFLMLGGLIAWGLFIRARRELLASLRERAERAEAERELEAQRAQLAERERIAREMHDVLAHRLSLLSLHAGVLEFRPDAPAEDVGRAAAVIRSNAHAALQELRAVIGALREDERGHVPEPPQPTLVDVPRLIDEARGAGGRITLVSSVVEPEAVPDSIGRHAYRVVQEGLTNARKHAAGCAVTVTIAGRPEEGLEIEVRNPLPVGVGAGAIPGAGAGLAGLRERVTLVGGRLEHGVLAAREHRLWVEMPWPT